MSSPESRSPVSFPAERNNTVGLALTLSLEASCALASRSTFRNRTFPENFSATAANVGAKVSHAFDSEP